MSDEQRMQLVRKIGLLGLSDLNKLAPIGDIGYLNAISFYHDFLRSGMIDAIIKAFYEQKQNNNWTVEGKSSRWRNTDNSYHCPELGLYWQVDSGD